MADIFVVTPKFRANWVNLLKPTVSKNYPLSPPQFSLTAGFPPETDFSKLNRALLDAAKEKGWASIPKKLSPFRLNGDSATPDAAFPEDWTTMRLTARGDSPPDLLGRDNQVITSLGEIYSGAWFDCQLNVYVSDKPSKYVALRMVRVRKLKDDERLGRPPVKHNAPSMDDLGEDDVEDLLN